MMIFRYINSHLTIWQYTIVYIFGSGDALSQRRERFQSNLTYTMRPVRSYRYARAIYVRARKGMDGWLDGRRYGTENFRFSSDAECQPAMLARRDETILMCPPSLLLASPFLFIAEYLPWLTARTAQRILLSLRKRADDKRYLWEKRPRNCVCIYVNISYNIRLCRVCIHVDVPFVRTRIK